jgi:amino acid adenylation domain-containing protein
MKQSSYPLSAMQLSMLLSSMESPEAGIYLIQYIGFLNEALHETTFRWAWERATQRHAVLRSAISWQTGAEPVQEVLEQAAVLWQVEDWRGLSPEELQNRLESYLQADRQGGVDFGTAPLMHMALFREAEAGYIFIWTFHHVILDGRSIARVVREVFEDYQALSEARSLVIPTPPPFQNYIIALQNLDLGAAERYWRSELGDFTASTSLGIDNPLTSDQGDDLFGIQETKLDRQTSDWLKSLAARGTVTLNTILQGAWAILLSRYSNSEDVLFGAVRACRHSTVAGSEDIVGLLINTVPLRVTLPRSTPLLPWLQELRKHWLAMRPYENTPLVQVKQWSGVPGGQPLFESMLMFENISPAAGLSALGGAWEKRRFIARQRADVPLDLNVYNEPELRLKLLFDRRRFNTVHIQRMLGHLVNLLQGMLEHPAGPIGSLPLLSQDENLQLLGGWNRTQREYPQDICVQQLFEAQAERTPDGIAVVYEAKQLTYRELNQQANQVAYRLRSLGVYPETPVGLYLDRSPEMMVGLLGILKAGGAYLPLDPVTPEARLDLLIADASLEFVLTTSEYLSNLPNRDLKVLCLDQEGWAEFPDEPDPLPASHAKNLAYILYTSGTTGKPKGVLVEHRQLTSYVYAVVDRYGMASPGAFAMLQPLTVDSCQTMIFPALGWGGTLHLISRERTLNPIALCEYFQNHAIDFLKIAPSHLQALLSAVDPPKLLPRRCLIIGGETSHWNFIEQLIALAPPCAIWNHYGPTETTVGVLTYPVSAEWTAHRPGSATLPLGKPLPNVQIYILDRHARLMPVGVPGELYVGGDLVSRGYLNRPEQTAAHFTPDPFRRLAGSRLYRTGDLARFLFDGSLEFLGRADDQVKLRGFRIELGEIEAVLGQHPAVAECVVLIHQTEAGAPQPVAYIVARTGQSLSAGELLSYARLHLPDVMVPAAIMLLPAMPRTEHGKIDRSALPQPDQDQFGSQPIYLAPRTPEEQALAAIWREVLGVEQIGVYDNFFDLGGHSLSAIRIIARIERQFEKQLPVSMVFHAPTIAQFAELLNLELSEPSPPD